MKPVATLRGVGRIKILYRLSVLEPLLYDIEVRSKVEGRSKTVDGWTGIIDGIWTPDMKKGSLFWGEATTFRFFDDYEKEKKRPRKFLLRRGTAITYQEQPMA